MPRLRRHLTAATALTAVSWAIPAGSEQIQFHDRPNLNFYGVTGVIDMPSALRQPDGEVTVTVSHMAGITRGTLSFQILPRVQGSFRYAGFQDLNFAGFQDYFDRSFDISLQVLRESAWLPAVKVGLQDFVGTGLYSGEYVVATKSLGPDIRVTAGLGWGRLGSYKPIGAPFGERPDTAVGRGGKPNTGEWFRGDAAPFAGIEWDVSERLTLMAEYSSDAYTVETGNDPNQSSSAILDRRSPFNFGAAYKLNDVVTLGGYYMYGDTVGVNLVVATNPYRPPVKGSLGPAPQQIGVRPDRVSDPGFYAENWHAETPDHDIQLLEATAEILGPQGIFVESIAVEPRRVDIRIRNTAYDSSAQAIGRTVRALTRTMPASVEEFRVVPVVNGMPTSSVTMRRTDVEATVMAAQGTAEIQAVTGIADPLNRPGGSVVNPAFPKFEWSLGPYIRNSYFDPEAPFRLDAGLRLAASYEPMPGLILSGSVAKKVVGNLDENNRLSNSVLPRVRTDFPLYDKEGDPALESLTAAYYFKPGTNLYGRVTAGYLERMFGGVSGELLWKPVDSRLGLGAELNFVRQRDYDTQLGFRDYDVVTGHVSAYYDLGNGFHTQLDVGRYLAGDVGATLSIDREFDNGWSLGAWATLTDVSAEEFGEGSFDKGIRLEIPLSWFTGQPSRRKLGTAISPVTRDGGARLNVDGRLYGAVRDYHQEGLDSQWGRVWR